MPSVTRSGVTRLRDWADAGIPALGVRRVRFEPRLSHLELAILTVMLSILVVIGVTAYMTMQRRAADSAAKTHLQQAARSIEEYFSQTGTYAGLSLSTLKARYDPALQVDRYRLSGLGVTGYCRVETTAARRTWHTTAPGVEPRPGHCP